MAFRTQRMAFFYESGRLRQAHLARDVTIQGHSFKKGNVVGFSPAGVVDLSLERLK